MEQGWGWIPKEWSMQVPAILQTFCLKFTNFLIPTSQLRFISSKRGSLAARGSGTSWHTDLQQRAPLVDNLSCQGWFRLKCYGFNRDFLSNRNGCISEFIQKSHGFPRKEWMIWRIFLLGHLTCHRSKSLILMSLQAPWRERAPHGWCEQKQFFLLFLMSCPAMSWTLILEAIMLIPVTLTFWLHALTSQLLKAEIFVSPTNQLERCVFSGGFPCDLLEAKSSSMAKVWTFATPKGEWINFVWHILVYILACSEGFFSGGIAWYHFVEYLEIS